MITALGAIAIGAHIGSVHIPERDYQHNFNPGIYVRHESGIAGGIYRNTLGRTTVYGGYNVKLGPVDVLAGAASGYQLKCQQECYGVSNAKISPFIAPSYRLPIEIIGVSPRVWLIPGYGRTSTVLHLSLELK